MKKQTLRIAVAAGVTIFSLVSLFSSTIAWFNNKIAIDVLDGTGETDSAYFAYGRGTVDEPYGINSPRHLYNLAWLQYNGMFNKDSNSDGAIDQQFYFEIDPNLNTSLDMTGWVLPPIGTETYPFLGQFNGNGKTITNLSVSNKADLDKPTSVTYNDQPEIIGFFGVVGELDGVPAYTYSSAVNTISDVTLENVSIESKTESTLIGLVAGYVNAGATGNGGLSDVLVTGTSSLDVDGQTAVDEVNLTSKLSDFGLVGYTTKYEQPTSEYSQTISEYYDSTTDQEGTGDDWGGSIDMTFTVERLADIKATGNGNTEPFVITHRYVDGVADPSGDQTTATQQLIKMKPAYSGANDFYGNYIYAYFTSHSATRHYMIGGRFERDAYYETYDNTSGYYITDGTNYLYFNTTNNALNNPNSATAAANRTIWEFETTNGTGYIRTVNNDVYYYLRNNNGTLTTTNNANQATTWTVIQENSNLRIENTINTTTYRLVFYENSFELVDKDYSFSTEAYISISHTSGGTTHYMKTTNNSTITDTTDPDEQIHWLKDVNGYYYYKSGNTNYYLITPSMGTSNGTNVSLGISTTYATTNQRANQAFMDSTSGTNVIRSPYYYYYNNRYQCYTYLRYSGGWVSTCRRSATYTTYYVTKANVPAQTVDYGDYYLNNTLSSTAIDSNKERFLNYDPASSYRVNYTAENTTYFPINVYAKDTELEDGTTGKKYEPTLKNTGYFTAGATTTTWSDQSSASPRSVAISSYSISQSINHSYINSAIADANVKTIKGSGIQTGIDPDDYIKYTDSKTQLVSNLEGKSAVGGLHFVSQGTDYGLISMDSIVKAERVSIQGEKYGITTDDDPDNDYYELPVYSIDFNLKRQGIINFFAGSYNGGYTGNNASNANCFFTLHKVYRDPNDKKTITNIREIQGIYSSPLSDEYVYSYKQKNGNNTTIVDEQGNSFSTTGLTLLFNTDWIGYNTTVGNNANSGYLYYFEIPVDGGEYCLGNVQAPQGQSKSDGCYLVYLDIGASGVDAMDRVYGFNIVTTAVITTFPVGVDFGVVGADGDGGESICIYIDAEADGAITFVLTNAGASLAITDTSGISTYVYKSETFGSSYIVSGNSPGTLVAETIKTRTNYFHIEQTDDVIHDIVITDVLEDTNSDGVDEVISSTYVLDGDETTYDTLIASVDAMNSERIARVRDLEGAITLTRSGGKADFESILADMPWEDPAVYDITIASATGLKITVTFTGEYTVKINDTSVANEGVYQF